MQQRYYDPMIPRFLSADPVTAYNDPIRAFHRYRYAAHSPYRFTDPDGRQEQTKGCDSHCIENRRRITQERISQTTRDAAKKRHGHSPSTLQGASNYVKENGVEIVTRGASIVGGFGQVAAGAGVCVGVVTCAGGSVLIALGANNIQEGVTGEPGYLRNGAHNLLGETGGDLAVDGANVVSSGAALLRPVVKPGVRKLFRNISSDFGPAYSAMGRTALTVEVVSGSVGAADAIQRANTDDE